MQELRIFATPFAKVYPMYVQKAERKNRTKAEVDQVISFSAQAPAMHPNCSLKILR